MKKLIPNLFELTLNNVSLRGGELNGKTYTSSDILEDILHHTAYEAKRKLMKLKLSQINLQSEKMVKDLNDILLYNKFMITLDVSYG